jgi:hypothetical protein
MSKIINKEIEELEKEFEKKLAGHLDLLMNTNGFLMKNL